MELDLTSPFATFQIWLGDFVLPDYRYYYFIIEHNNGVSCETKTTYYKCRMVFGESLFIGETTTLGEVNKMKSSSACARICVIYIKFASIDKMTIYNSGNGLSVIGLVDINLTGDSEAVAF